MVETLDDNTLDSLELAIVNTIVDAMCKLEHNAKTVNDLIPSLKLDKQPSYQQAVNSLGNYYDDAIDEIKKYGSKK